MSDVNVALANVDAFEAEASKNVAWQLDRQDIVNRLRELLRNPDLLNQRALNACGPAAFFRIWLARDPVAAAAFACTMLRDGSASIGSLSVAPSWKLLGQDYAALRAATDAAHPGSTPECTEWMLISALRDSENIWFDYAGEPYTVGDSMAGLTLPSTLAAWLSSTSLYSSVANDTNLVSPGNLQQLLGLIPTSDVDIVLFVNPSAIYDLQPSPAAAAPQGELFSYPNHYILMTAPFAEGADSTWINIEVWTWGTKKVGWQGSQRFISNYFGLITATV